MSEKEFGGDKKLPMRTLLAKYERRLIDSLVPKFPSWIEGYHLTLMNIPLSIGLIVFGYFARNNHSWLWVSSLILFLQWFTDSFDGALGRYRDTGIPKWGFYMDHFLDFVFMCSLVIGYSFLFVGVSRQIVFFLIPIFGCYMMSAITSFAATGEFKITYLGTGPTEMRIWFIIINTLIIIFGTYFIEKILIYILIISIVMLSVIIFRTQKYIWNKEMKAKQLKKEKNDEVR